MRDKQDTNMHGIMSFEVTETRQLSIVYNICLAPSNYLTMATFWFYPPLRDRVFVSILLQGNWEFEKFNSLPKGSRARKLGKQVSLIWSWVSPHCTILFLKAELPSLACSFCFRVDKCCSSGGHIGITWTALKSTDWSLGPICRVWLNVSGGRPGHWVFKTPRCF